MLEKLKEKLAHNGFYLDPYYSFFLQFDLDKYLQHKVFFEEEGLDFKFSYISIPWRSVRENLIFFGTGSPNLSDFFTKFNIDYQNDKIDVEEIYSLDKMLSLFDSAFVHDPNFKNGFVQIGTLESPIHSRLMYSVRKQDFGSIWLDLPDETFLVKLSDNIILLLNKGSISIQEANITRFGGAINRLYKNLEEDFWRIKKQ